MKILTKNISYAFAFTLAEVLIVLGILGIVAEMTIPTVVQNTREAATISALKKAYSSLSQAYSLSMIEFGEPKDWAGIMAADRKQIFIDNLEKNLRVVQRCDTTGCFPNTIYKNLKGGPWMNFSGDSNYPKFQLADGTVVAVFVENSCGNMVGATNALKSVCGRYYVDVNGSKSPNKSGADLFVFYFTNYGVVPIGTQQEDLASSNFDTSCSDNKQHWGLGCAAWALYNENLDYLKCTGLSWAGKTKCN